jgi:hypothetical protein
VKASAVSTIGQRLPGSQKIASVSRHHETSLARQAEAAAADHGAHVAQPSSASSSWQRPAAQLGETAADPATIP